MCAVERGQRYVSSFDKLSAAECLIFSLFVVVIYFDCGSWFAVLQINCFIFVICLVFILFRDERVNVFLCPVAGDGRYLGKSIV